MNAYCGQTSLLIVEYPQNVRVQQDVTIGGAWLATNNKNSETTLAPHEKNRYNR
jgi:hypothetical protein